MAESPAHKFGQIIGDLLENSIEPLLAGFAQRHGLYLDKKGPRAARTGKRVAWIDRFGNVHDLDYVFERGGTAAQIGTPVAFIETAWRRYTKHSRNKAQEIQGAILPLVETHRNAAPFIGAILAGVFTEGALTQMRSLGFSILYFPYETVMQAFGRTGIDACYDERTADQVVLQKVSVWESLSPEERAVAATALVEINEEEVRQFMESLGRAVLREIELIRVLPLHGLSCEWSSLEEAIAFIENYDEDSRLGAAIRYEVEVRYSNGDRIQAQFKDKESGVAFLRSFQPPLITAASGGATTHRGRVRRRGRWRSQD